jgi:hypothetical protein
LIDKFSPLPLLLIYLYVDYKEIKEENYMTNNKKLYLSIDCVEPVFTIVVLETAESGF